MSLELTPTQEAERTLTELYRENYPVYARQCLRIRSKSGAIKRFEFNRSQRFFHDKIEDQRKRTGRVRQIILKGRQVGISTYIAGRSYQKTTFNGGFRSYLLTHLDDATDNLFAMIKRFHDNVPDFVSPLTGAINSKELVFPKLDSGFRVSTAGNKSGGRSHTLQVFHGSEVGFWPNGEDHIAGVMQAIADEPGTEVYLESTANGTGNVFHRLWTAAENGEPPFECVFIPWFWHEEYEKEPIDADWFPPGELHEYQRLYRLSIEQIYWVYLKNLELGRACGGKSDEICWLFRREYPGNAVEAFQTSANNSFITGDLVQKARRGRVQGHGPIILGVDVARGGGDKSAIVDRQGRRIGGHVCKAFDFGKDTAPLVGEVVRLVRDLRSAGHTVGKVVVDATGIGGPVYDVLRERLGGKLVEGVEFGGHAHMPDRFANRRAEMWERMRGFFMGEAPVACPDDNDLMRDVCAPAWGDGQMTRHRTDGTLIIEDKNHIRKRMKFSPDLGDACALTFAIDFSQLVREKPHMTYVTGPGSWMAT